MIILHFCSFVCSCILTVCSLLVNWKFIFPHTHTHTHLTALCPGLPWWASTRKVKPIWILLKQETVSGSGIRWAICNSAPCSRQITTPEPHRSVFFTGLMPFLPHNQQCQSTEGFFYFPTITRLQLIVTAVHIILLIISFHYHKVSVIICHINWNTVH